MSDNITRRGFIKKSSIVAAGTALGASALSAKSYSRIMGANDRINFAIIGLRSRGWGHLDGVLNNKNTMVTHICDVDKRYFEKFSQETEKLQGQKPVWDKDIRKMLESNDIDVITIATPEHWHAPMAVMGLQAGLHVYVEKPCSHNPREGELLVEAQKKYGKLVQLGNQQRSSEFTRKLMKRIHEGLIGDVYFGKAWYTNSRGSIGIGKNVPVPDYLDWDLWQGPAPRRAYKDNVHPYNWHWFWHWGTGETLNNGTHEVDLCRWALGVDYPNKVTASGGRYQFKDDWEFYDTLITNYEYDDKLITWEGHSCNGGGYQSGRGAALHGKGGSVTIDRAGYKLYNMKNELIEDYRADQKSDSADLQSRDSMTVLHFGNLINAIRDDEKLHSPINEGNKSVTILQLSNIAWKRNKTLELDESNAHIRNDEAAMESLWRREYEPGWELRI
jgi:predicted dehydrogenase